MVTGASSGIGWRRRCCWRTGGGWCCGVRRGEDGEALRAAAGMRSGRGRCCGRLRSM
ncbi:MAG: hypothetical protein U0232_10655 [Thermomicrobiales bacterium]